MAVKKGFTPNGTETFMGLRSAGRLGHYPKPVRLEVGWVKKVEHWQGAFMDHLDAKAKKQMSGYIKVPIDADRDDQPELPALI